MKKELLFKLAAVLTALMLSCSALSGCGKDKETAPAETSDEGDTTVSKFDAGEKDKKPATAAPKTTAAVPAKAGDAASKSGSGSGSGNSGGSGANVSSAEAVSRSALSDARSFFEAGMYDDAEEMLRSVNPDYLTDEQLDTYYLISDSLSNRAGAQNESKKEFTAEEAISAAEQKYGVSIDGDPSGLTPQTDSNGRQYYTMQVAIQSENRRVTINVYSDGEIEETSEEPLAYG